MDYYYFMDKAIEEAKKALKRGEVPIGAVVVKNGEIIGRGYNQKETSQKPTAHAEIIAMEEAAKNLNNWRLNGCKIYITLEPCPMCSGAMLQGRIDEVIFGAWDLKWGGAGTIIDVLRPNLFNHTVKVTGGIKEAQCQQLLTDFFSSKR